LAQLKLQLWTGNGSSVGKVVTSGFYHFHVCEVIVFYNNNIELFEVHHSENKVPPNIFRNELGLGRYYLV
jgi:hypothetical protein